MLEACLLPLECWQCRGRVIGISQHSGLGAGTDGILQGQHPASSESAAAGIEWAARLGAAISTWIMLFMQHGHGCQSMSFSNLVAVPELTSQSWQCTQWRQVQLSCIAGRSWHCSQLTAKLPTCPIYTTWTTSAALRPSASRTLPLAVPGASSETKPHPPSQASAAAAAGRLPAPRPMVAGDGIKQQSHCAAC